MIKKGVMSVSRFRTKQLKGSQVRKEHVFLDRFRYWPWIYGKREDRNKHFGYNPKKMLFEFYWPKLQRSSYLKATGLEKMKMGRFVMITRVSMVEMRNKSRVDKYYMVIE